MSVEVVPNITYLTANNFDAKLDVYTVRGATAPVPTLIYFGPSSLAGARTVRAPAQQTSNRPLPSKLV